VIELGGSRAQRDVFHDTLLEACFRAKDMDRAERLLAERVARRPDRFWKTRTATGTAAARHEVARGARRAAPCSRPQRLRLAGRAGRDADLVRLTFLQINDHYVLGPVDGGRRGGMARLATLVRDVRRENPSTVFVLGGDFLSPSVESTFLQGAQMVAALNAIGLDYVTFGTTSSTSGRPCSSSA